MSTAPQLRGSSAEARRHELLGLLRCSDCAGELNLAGPAQSKPGPGVVLACRRCERRYPIIGGTVRMLPGPARATAGDHAVKRRTAESFAYEWQHFGDLRPEWERNFLEYMQPHGPEFFRDKLVLDVGCGSGRHSRHAVALGARVVAVDLGDSIDGARANLPDDVLTVQADAEHLPFAPASFDFVMSIGVLHHLPHPERALARIAALVRPGGRIHVYLYWQPERAGHRAILRLVTAARRLTTRLPHRLLHLLCWPLAAVLQLAAVTPYRALRGRRRGRRLANALPLKTYADYPFSVLVNDQFDRLSAPIEHRFERDEVAALMRRGGFTDVRVLPNHGWVADGQAPE